jgi:ribosomal protein S18 acetylase RimI-like enzyme
MIGNLIDYLEYRVLSSNFEFWDQLYVNTENLPAIRLYEKMGFRKIKEVKDICGPKEICYEMELRIL